MPNLNRIADFADEIAAWRQNIHRHPETQFDVHRTAGVVVERMREFGVDEIVPGIGRTGVVGLIHGQKRASGRVVGLRADMDALPITETTGLAHASTVPGKMHACGHDGHTAMLLGAAKYLAETRNFDGSVALIFQPAEEGGGGGREMVDEGMMDRFAIDEVYGMHNMPDLPVGSFAMRPGPMMAAADEFTIEITGYGGHAARPHRTVDATLVAAHIAVMLQSIVSRSIDPIHSAVLSVTKIHAGDAFNVIPETATLSGTVRSLDPGVRDVMERRMGEVVENVAKALGATAVLYYRREYPVVVNHERETAFAAEVAREVAGDSNVDVDTPPVMGGEDFAFMLNARPGAFVYVGNGDTAPVHHPQYDFNDEAIPSGCSFWVRLVERALPLSR